MLDMVGRGLELIDHTLQDQSIELVTSGVDFWTDKCSFLCTVYFEVWSVSPDHVQHVIKMYQALPFLIGRERAWLEASDILIASF